MDKEEFIELLHKDIFSSEDLQQIEKLKTAYPWFAIPRFLELRIRAKEGAQPSHEKIAAATVFSPDRKHLYDWLNQFSGINSAGGLQEDNEIEFLDETASDQGASTFELMEDAEDRMETDADVVGVSEKDEADMEDPDIKPESAVPSIDPIEEEEETPGSDLSFEEPIELETESSIEAGPDNEKEKDDHTAEKGKGDQPVDLLLRNTFSEEGTARTGKSNGLIEQFLERDPGVIKADKATNLEGDVSEHSVKEDDSFITDTLAKIYVKQGLHAKAIYAYERLSLKYPEKSAYFAAQIEKIKESTTR